MPTESFKSFFHQATRSASHPEGLCPHPYQEILAAEPITSRLIHVPTGCGKTAAVVLAWLSPLATRPPVHWINL
jgi:Lhr-like helicase